MAEAPIYKRRLISATVETTKGTAATVTAALADTVVRNINMVPTDMYGEERFAHFVSSGELPRTKGPQFAVLTFQTELAHFDGFTTLAQGCGLSYAAGPPRVWTPTTAQGTHKCLTFGVFMDGVKAVLRGACGTFTLSAANAGARVLVDWTFTGILDTPTDVALPSFSPVSTKGWRNAGVTTTIGGSTPPNYDGFTLDLGANVQPRESVADASAIEHFIVTEINPTLQITPESATVSAWDHYGKLIGGTTEALVMTFSDASGNDFQIDAAALQQLSVGDEERNGKSVRPINFGCFVTSSGDDQIKFTDTAAA